MSEDDDVHTTARLLLLVHTLLQYWVNASPHHLYRSMARVATITVALLLSTVVSFQPPIVRIRRAPDPASRHRTLCHVKRRQRPNIPKRKPRNSNDVLWIEKELKRDRGHFPILGSDESGRGAVAGPVVVATCAIIQDYESYEPIPGVRDSKELSPDQREAIYEEVMSKKDIYVWSVAEKPSTDIDESNILVTTMDCFKNSIEECFAHLPDQENAYSIVDGKKAPKLSINVSSRPWVQGDKDVYSISLASILAKVTRDRMAEQWHQKYPEYGFNVHRGYATPGHVEAIHKHGPCPLHRLSFKTLKGRS